MKPSIFVGSSSESLDIPRAIQLQLRDVANVTLWTDLDTPGKYTLEALINAAERFDFAVFVFAPDDDVRSRGVRGKMVRDNVIFELGLFMGRLGRSRTFILEQTNAGLKTISDLVGLTVVFFDPPSKTLKARVAVGPACTTVRGAVLDLGVLDQSGKQLALMERDVRDQESRLATQQEVINQLVIFSMSQPTFAKLQHLYWCKREKRGEYIYREDYEEDTRREFLFLRDHGFIALADGGYFSPGPHLIGRDIVPLLELTPIGRFYVERREDLQRRLHLQS